MPLFKMKTGTMQAQTSWRELTIFSGYRVFLAVTLFAVFYWQLSPEYIGETVPALYSATSQFYLFISLILLLFSSRCWGKFESQIMIHLIIDIVVITLLVHASGGLKTGLASLLVVVVVAGGTLIPGRIAAFISAVATVAVLLEASYRQFVEDDVTHYSHAGMLGVIFFTTVVLVQILSKKIQVSQHLAEQRQQAITKLAMLNEHIVSRMQTGVIVVEFSGKVKLSNQSARRLLGIDNIEVGDPLKKWAPKLAQQIWAWQQHQTNAFEPFQARADLPQVLTDAMLLDSGEIVLYIENISATSKQVQKLKLASLGRLTASIAHEVRNPLGAISHAGELLVEISNNDETITKLTDIILRHSARVNGIIDTILQMSRRKKVEPTTVMLAHWLEQFVDEFCEYKHLDRNNIKVLTTAHLARVYIDVEQLHQIIWNLVENAWHYADLNQTLPGVEINLSIQDTNVNIDVIDNGPGVSKTALPKLFEPFHSERQGGVGLGLYLARELCLANGAWLNYLPEHSGRSCFRISWTMERRESLQ